MGLTAISLGVAAATGQPRRWFDAKARLLRRVGGFVQHMLVDELLGWDPEGNDPIYIDMQQLAAQSGSGWQLGSDVLAHLSPSGLQYLGLQGVAVDAAAAAALQSLTGMLRLTADCHEHSARSLAAALPSLARLQDLNLAGSKVPQELPAVLQCLPQLTRLSCTCPVALPDLSAVLQLTGLRDLWWQEEESVGLQRVDVQQLVARLPCLQSWDIARRGVNNLWRGNMQVWQVVGRRH